MQLDFELNLSHRFILASDTLSVKRVEIADFERLDLFVLNRGGLLPYLTLVGQSLRLGEGIELVSERGEGRKRGGGRERGGWERERERERGRGR